MKNKSAQALARLRAESLSPERRREIASIAGKASGVVRLRKSRVKKLIATRDFIERLEIESRSLTEK